MLRAVREACGALLRVLFCGCLGLSLVGFALYLRRQLRERTQQGMLVLLAYLSTFGQATGHDPKGAEWRSKRDFT